MNHIRLVEAEHMQAPLYEPSPRRRCVVLVLPVSVLLWAVLIFAIIGVVAVFGSRA